MILLDKKFPNIFKDKKNIYTKSLDKKTYFEERTKREGKNVYREWDPKRSKLAAGLIKGISQIGFKEGSIVLYLGASHGYTVSFVSDIIGKNGFIFAIDIAPQVTRDLVRLAEERNNIAPILANCNHPEEYKDTVSKSDIVYQDIAQKNQVQIFLKNCDAYLNSGGFGLLALKARSMDVTKKPKDLFKQVMKELEEKISVVDYRVLDPYEKDHALFIVKKK
ncbi:fibrillarin-like rRNA/tRNA 2'-O-methyltransferase [Candidatus Woesearchaeota archaeon]|nr:fibrillarin-like rRNA/tRNA 2'-O-methyltransferase [Candidatus Woesearchaeota archaeon]